MCGGELGGRISDIRTENKRPMCGYSSEFQKRVFSSLSKKFSRFSFFFNINELKFILRIVLSMFFRIL